MSVIGSELGSDARHRRRSDLIEFIQTNMPVAPAPSLPEIRIHTARPTSRLWRLRELGGNKSDPPPPYWAYHWAGGAALARHILDRPETVRGRRVLDLGAGSGIVGIAAAKSGASEVIAADIDRNAIVALSLNAAINGVALRAVAGDITGAVPPPVDLVAAGDLFYDRDLAERVTTFLDRCLAAGIEVMIGDPGRAFLPFARLRRLAEYPVQDFGDGKNAASKPSGVFALRPNGG